MGVLDKLRAEYEETLKRVEESKSVIRCTYLDNVTTVKLLSIMNADFFELEALTFCAHRNCCCP